LLSARSGAGLDSHNAAFCGIKDSTSLIGGTRLFCAFGSLRSGRLALLLPLGILC
jgi:hypothetical protein